MTRSEFEAVVTWQKGVILELEATLGLLKAFHEETQNLFKAQEQMNSKLHYSMEVFDPGYEWDNTGAYGDN